ncbi:hypothetical protein [Halosimplex marinum]|uniref:hypothetical protein n=1 Tax=Halosimplex marinum TaxID=3396620 RepID=UPI003F577E93
MTDEILGAITSDKVETDNTNFATLKADQTCEEALIPRDNPVRQRNWQVTLEKGSVYNPQEDIGIYAQEVDCKYGVQVDGTVFGRDTVSVEHGGAVHGAAGDGDDEPPVIGARILGSVVAEGSIEVVSPDSKLDDWEPRPVSVYGDVVGGHVSFEEPTVVYGNVTAEQMLWVDAPTVVFGDVRSEGSIEATDLFAFSVTARDDVNLGERVVTVNPVVRSAEGSISMADDVAVFDSATLARTRDAHGIDEVALGLWVLDDDAVWEGGRLVPDDVFDHGDGEIATRAWRTVSEPDSEYRYIESLFTRSVDQYRRDPPDIDQFRYGGLASMADSGPDEGGVTVEHSGEGDVVLGDQDKEIDSEDLTKIDNSVTDVTERTTVHDERTTIEDSVLKDTEVAGAGADDPSDDEATEAKRGD